MELLEIKDRERLPREVVAARLRALADDLARHNQREVEEDEDRAEVVSA